MAKQLAAPCFNTIVVDPPWPISMAGKFKRRYKGPTALPYASLTISEIEHLPIRAICSPGAHVYLWATNKTLHDAFHMLEVWGISYHMTLVMTKPSGMAPALGYVFGTEFCLLGFASHPMLPFTSIGALNWLSRPSVRGQHSSKPDEFYSLVEKMSPQPYADLFARKCRPGWAVWGDEVQSDFDLFQGGKQAWQER